MKDFIERNKPVIIISLLTALLFLGIIALAQFQQKRETQLIKVEDIELIYSHTPIKGDKDAPIQLVVFSDFQCPGCKQAHSILEELQQKYKQYVVLGYRHFPLPMHKHAVFAARATQAAKNQDKFWEMADAIFLNQASLNEELIMELAQKIGLDIEKLKMDMNSKEVQEAVSIDLELANRIQLTGTPSIFVNGQYVTDDPEALIREEVSKITGEKVLRNDTQTPIVNEEAIPSDTPSNNQTDPVEQPTTTITETINDTIQIEFSDSGFSPQNRTVLVGQKIRWFNKTDKDLLLKQRTAIFNEFKNPIIVKPNDFFEFTFNKQTMWTYYDDNTGISGSLFIMDAEKN